jgi:glycosyltransferase involved in cell wall biosynthesis
MRIGIDISSAVNQAAGVGRYTRELVANLLNIDKKNEYVLHSFFGDASEFARHLDISSSQPHAYKLQTHNFNGRMLRAYALGLRLLGLTPNHLIENADVFHMPDFAVPVPRKIPGVLTIHDLIFLRYPKYFTRVNRTYMRQMAQFSADNAKVIITDSLSTKKDIIDYLSVPEDKISVIYLAAGKQFKPADSGQVNEVIARFGISMPYLLYVGTLEPRKNVITLLESFSYCHKKDRDFPYRLVIAGKKGWLYEDIFQRVEELQLTDKVIFTGFVHDRDLPALYSGASAFIYPSIYEGFGFPIIEAMSCGIPVICANTSSLLEVAGDAALLHDPMDVEQLAETILKVTGDSILCRDMIDKGFANAGRFSWERTAAETLKVYDKVYEVLKV